MSLVFFLEEPSVREMLKGLLPRVVPHVTTVTYIVFEGKQDLDKNVVRRLRGWRAPKTPPIAPCSSEIWSGSAAIPDNPTQSSGSHAASSRAGTSGTSKRWNEGPQLSLTGNTSHSFRVFLQGIQRAAGA